MEKYRKFADQGSGINPFLPLSRRNYFTIFKSTIGLVLLTIRIPILIVLFAMLFVYHNFFKSMAIVKEARRFVVLFLHLFIYRIIMLCFGFFTFKTTHKFFTRDANIPKMASGWVILCNHTSPVDFLYLSYVLSPTFVKAFVRVKNNGEKEFLLAPLTFWNTLKYFFTKDFQYPVVGTEVELSTMTPYKKLNLVKLGEYNFDNKEGPIAIFFEGVFTNGKGVLEINELLANDLYEYQKKYLRNTVLMSFEYNHDAHSTVRHPLMTCINLLMNPINHMNVRISSIPKIPSQNKEMATVIHESFELEHGLPKLSLTYEDYLGFLEAWNANKTD